MKKAIFIIICILIFSCSSNVKHMEMDKNGNYIVYKLKLPGGYWEQYEGKYRIYELVTDYGLRMDSDWNGNLKNIYLYDGKNGIEYIIKNINDLENILINKFPSNIVINYYEFCISGSGIKNSQEIEENINFILKKNNIKFIYKIHDSNVENYKSNKIIMDTCLGG